MKSRHFSLTWVKFINNRSFEESVDNAHSVTIVSNSVNNSSINVKKEAVMNIFSRLEVGLKEVLSFSKHFSKDFEHPFFVVSLCK